MIFFLYVIEISIIIIGCRASLKNPKKIEFDIIKPFMDDFLDRHTIGEIITETIKEDKQKKINKKEREETYKRLQHNKSAEEATIPVINNLEGLKFAQPATQLQIEQAEKALGLKFADDYKKYLSTFGVMCARGIVLTGLSSIKEVDVVTATIEGRRKRNIPPNAYVIEDIDDIVIIQERNGGISTVSAMGTVHVCDTLTDYILQHGHQKPVVYKPPTAYRNKK